MGDSSGDVRFEHLLEKTHVLESLAITLDQMLAGSYISKNTAAKIINEATRQYNRLLKRSKYAFPSHYMIGHLQQYKQSGTEWTFSVANPVISLCMDTTHSGNRAPIVTIDKDFVGEDGAPRIKSNMPFNECSVAFCHAGYVKVKAIVNRIES